MPLWIAMAYLYSQIIVFDQANITNLLTGALYFILFGIHEASHVIFGFLPAVYAAAAGSVGEVIFTLFLTFVALRKKAYFGASFCLLWMALAFKSAGNYMADAQKQSIPLLGFGDSPQHDWSFVFTQLNILDKSESIGMTIQNIGLGIGAFGLLFGLIILLLMAFTGGKQVSDSTKSDFYKNR
jgi:hypothetical protein